MATVGSVYAKAVFELSADKGGPEQVSKQLRDFWETVKSHAGLEAVLAGPASEAGKRKAILRDIAAAAGIAGLAKNLLELLAARGRLSYVPAVADQLDALIEASQGIMAGKVRSAVEMSAEEVAVLSASLAKRVGGRVRLTQEVDPSLLGGVVATVGGRTFDASLRTQIERFKNELI
jgi:F-type H+-transporting ATPase subunit delta